MTVRLIVTEGQNPGQSFELKSGQTYDIGSSPGAAIAVDDPQVAPLHCRIYSEANQQFTVYDVSGKGLFVNEKRVIKKQIGDTDLIRVGNTTLQLIVNATDSLAIASVEAPKVSYPELHVVEGTDTGKVFELAKKNAFVMGRGADADVTVMDIKVSRNHCRIDVIDGGYFITDLGSTNGIRVNGKKVDRHRLVEGDEIKLGYSRLIFKQKRPEAARPDSEKRLSAPSVKAPAPPSSGVLPPVPGAGPPQAAHLKTGAPAAAKADELFPTPSAFQTGRQPALKPPVSKSGFSLPPLPAPPSSAVAPPPRAEAVKPPATGKIPMPPAPPVAPPGTARQAVPPPPVGAPPPASAVPPRDSARTAPPVPAVPPLPVAPPPMAPPQDRKPPTFRTKVLEAPPLEDEYPMGPPPLDAIDDDLLPVEPRAVAAPQAIVPPPSPKPVPKPHTPDDLIPPTEDLDGLLDDPAAAPIPKGFRTMEFQVPDFMEDDELAASGTEKLPGAGHHAPDMSLGFKLPDLDDADLSPEPLAPDPMDLELQGPTDLPMAPPPTGFRTMEFQVPDFMEEADPEATDPGSFQMDLGVPAAPPAAIAPPPPEAADFDDLLDGPSDMAAAPEPPKGFRTMEFQVPDFMEDDLSSAASPASPDVSLDIDPQAHRSGDLDPASVPPLEAPLSPELGGLDEDMPPPLGDLAEAPRAGGFGTMEFQVPDFGDDLSDPELAPVVEQPKGFRTMEFQVPDFMEDDDHAAPASPPPALPPVATPPKPALPSSKAPSASAAELSLGMQLMGLQLPELPEADAFDPLAAEAVPGGLQTAGLQIPDFQDDDSQDPQGGLVLGAAPVAAPQGFHTTGLEIPDFQDDDLDGPPPPLPMDDEGPPPPLDLLDGPSGGTFVYDQAPESLKDRYRRLHGQGEG